MSTPMNTNGRVRKTLATQLDRLDGILDALSDGLNDAVATTVERAVGQAVQQAVESVLTQVLTNPVLQQQLTTAAAAVQPAEGKSKQGIFARMKAWVGDKLQQAGRTVKATCLAVADRVRKNGMAVATVAGLVAFAARKQIAAAASTVGGWGRNLATAAGSALGRLLPGLACCGT